MQLTTDGHRPYLVAVREAFGSDVDYAMLIKCTAVTAAAKVPRTGATAPER